MTTLAVETEFQVRQLERQPAADTLFWTEAFQLEVITLTPFRKY